MSFYQKIYGFLGKYYSANTLLKRGLNLSPMFRRTTGKIEFVSKDLHHVVVRIPISYRNRNYVGSIFGGSLFSATDPIVMMQLVQILGRNYVVWDKSSSIRFKRPAFKTVYAYFDIDEKEIEAIKNVVKENGETDYLFKVNITDKERRTVFCELEKNLYIADKTFYKEKRKRKEASQKQV